MRRGERGGFGDHRVTADLMQRHRSSHAIALVDQRAGKHTPCAESARCGTRFGERQRRRQLARAHQQRRRIHRVQRAHAVEVRAQRDDEILAETRERCVGDGTERHHGDQVRTRGDGRGVRGRRWGLARSHGEDARGGEREDAGRRER